MSWPMASRPSGRWDGGAGAAVGKAAALAYGAGASEAPRPARCSPWCDARPVRAGFGRGKSPDGRLEGVK